MQISSPPLLAKIAQEIPFPAVSSHHYVLTSSKILFSRNTISTGDWLHDLPWMPKTTNMRQSYIPYFSMYKTILLSKIFRLKIGCHLIHGSKLRREQKQVGGKQGSKQSCGTLIPFPLHLLSPTYFS